MIRVSPRRAQGDDCPEKRRQPTGGNEPPNRTVQVERNEPDNWDDYRSTRLRQAADDDLQLTTSGPTHDVVVVANEIRYYEN